MMNFKPYVNTIKYVLSNPSCIFKRYDFANYNIKGVSGKIKRNILISYYVDIYNELLVKDVIKCNYIRMGGTQDGAYVMIDDLDGINRAYSLGIGDDVSFDFEIAEKGIDVYQYDHTIECLPCNHRKFHWYKRGVAGKTNIEQNLYSLDDLIKENGHIEDKNMILKMDIEGYEWDMLSCVSETTLDNFKQIVCELHFPGDLNSCYALPVLKKINKTHQLVHIHANNVAESNYYINDKTIVPWYVEACYVRKKDYSFMQSDRTFPTEIDLPNIPTKDDICLGKYNTRIETM